jgi:hypothetical protein
MIPAVTLRTMRCDVALCLALVLAGCAAAPPGAASFEAEPARVQSAIPREARLVGSTGPRRDGLRTEASWEYELGGDPDTARMLFLKGVPPEYHSVRQSDGEAAYARYDGHDSFSLTFSFSPSGPRSTRVAVRLQSMPD